MSHVVQLVSSSQPHAGLLVAASQEADSLLVPPPLGGSTTQLAASPLHSCGTRHEEVLALGAPQEPPVRADVKTTNLNAADLVPQQELSETAGSQPTEIPSTHAADVEDGRPYKAEGQHVQQGQTFEAEAPPGREQSCWWMFKTRGGLGSINQA